MSSFSPVKISQNYDPGAPVVHRTPEGKIRYRASGLGKCIRALVACRTGHPPEAKSDQLLEFCEAGKNLESEVVEKSGLSCVEAGTLILPIPESVPPAEIAGKCDGLQPLGDCRFRLLEVKLLSSSRADSLLSQDLPGLVREWPQYAWQTSAYWHALVSAGYVIDGLAFVVGKRIKGSWGYEVGSVATNNFSKPAFSLDQIYARIRTVEAFARASGVRGEPVLPDCDWHDPYCDFSYLHDSKESHVIESGSEEDKPDTPDTPGAPIAVMHKDTNPPHADPELARFLAAESALSQIQDHLDDDLPKPRELGITMSARWYYLLGKLEKASKDYRGRFKKYLESTTRDQKKTQAEEMSISWTTPRKRRFDRSKLEEEHPDLAEQFTKVRTIEKREFDEESFREDHPDLWESLQVVSGKSSMRVTKRR